MNHHQIILIGAGGHGRVLADIARLNGYTSIGYLDDGDKAGLLGKVRDFVRFVDCADFFVAIGNNMVRKRITEQLQEYGASITNLIHPRAVIAEDVEMGTGVAVMAGAVVNSGSRIGDGVILNTCCSVDHDNIIGEYVHVSAGAHLAGTVSIGACTFVCVGVTVINNISICGDCVIGAGAVVVRDITEPGIYKGVPAKK